jgi:hypothetical protein
MANTLIASLVSRLLNIPERLQKTVAAYLLALVLDGAKKTLSQAAMTTGVHKSQLLRLLTNHGDLALASLQLLAAEAAKLAGIDRMPLVKGSQWQGERTPKHNFLLKPVLRSL